jgi:outer membrane protein assembly factor BamB
MVDGPPLRRGRPCALVLSACVGLALLAASPALAVASEATIVTPMQGPPAVLVRISGSGSGASEAAGVLFASTPEGTTTTSPGPSSSEVTIPRFVTLGEYTVTAAEPTSGLAATARFAVSVNWPKYRFSGTDTGFNPFETVVSPASVSGLSVRWTGATGIPIRSSPAVVNGIAYIGSDGLYAFSAGGTTGCAGTPKTCQPLWRGITTAQIESSPAVAGSVVYAGSNDGELYAFSATGTTGCTGTPKTCQPLWTADAGAPFYQIISSPDIAGGVVYVGSGNGRLYAFSATGTTGCSGTPKTCQPLWTATTGSGIFSSPAVAGGVVYVGSSDRNLYAFSATGTTGCSGTPKVCRPLWTAATHGAVSTPAVSGGTIFADDNSGELWAFRASNGQQKWMAHDGGCSTDPAVAYGIVYLGTGPCGGSLLAFSAAGSTNCSGTPKTCRPLWSAPDAAAASPSVANGVVYTGSGDSHLYAFSAAGTSHCAGTPKTCTPLLAIATGSGIASSPAIANGVVYVASTDGKLYAIG